MEPEMLPLLGIVVCRLGTAWARAVRIGLLVEEEEEAVVGGRRVEGEGLVVLFVRGKGALRVSSLEGSEALGAKAIAR